mmetsp:Transcript_13041/g.25727  ORF Transcript_13041/g.25727 Transcript_13041/m.25727 type:complete len:90 (-) Transcript_13041:153-422(-)
MAILLPFMEVGKQSMSAPHVDVERLTRYQLCVFGSLATLPSYNVQRQKSLIILGVSFETQASSVTFLTANHLGWHMKYSPIHLKIVNTN